MNKCKFYERENCTNGCVCEINKQFLVTSGVLAGILTTIYFLTRK